MAVSNTKTHLIEVIVDYAGGTNLYSWLHWVEQCNEDYLGRTVTVP